MKIQTIASTGLVAKAVEFSIQELLILKDASGLLQILRDKLVTVKASSKCEHSQEDIEMAVDAAFNVGIMLENITANHVTTLAETADRLFEPNAQYKEPILDNTCKP